MGLAGVVLGSNVDNRYYFLLVLSAFLLTVTTGLYSMNNVTTREARGCPVEVETSSSLADTDPPPSYTALFSTSDNPPPPYDLVSRQALLPQCASQAQTVLVAENIERKVEV